MSFLLAIESATKSFSAALFKDGVLLQEVKSLPDETASQKLLPLIQKLLAEQKIELNKLKGIAVGTGPGGFTGLRVGLSTAVGLATFHEIPILGVSTLEAMALGAGKEGLIISVLPAGRGQVYAGLYRAEAGILKLEMDEAIFNPADLEAFLKDKKEPILKAPPPEASFIGLLALQKNPPPLDKYNIKIKYLQDPDFGKKANP